MTTTDVLREEVRQYIDIADDKSLRMVKALLQIELEEDDTEEDEANMEEENWDDLPKELKLMIDKGIKEANEGKGTPHEQVMEKYSKWFKK